MDASLMTVLEACKLGLSGVFVLTPPPPGMGSAPLLSSLKATGSIIDTIKELAKVGSDAGLILGLRPANERQRYFVTTSLICWVQAKNQPWTLWKERNSIVYPDGSVSWANVPTLGQLTYAVLVT